MSLVLQVIITYRNRDSRETFSNCYHNFAITDLLRKNNIPEEVRQNFPVYCQYLRDSRNICYITYFS